jgi:uncharacterized protein YfaP (DUF2135 family)
MRLVATSCFVLLAALLAWPSLMRAEEVALPADAPLLRITSPRGGQTRERVVTIDGEARGIDAPRLTLVLNGVALSIPHQEGRFSTSQILAPGPNQIRVTAILKNGGIVGDEVAVHALVPSKDLRVTMTWDTNGTDIDLWVTGPDGEKVFYSNKNGKAGGSLDVDVTTGFGPETYTQARAQPGTYKVQAHYYSGAVPTRAKVTIVRGEGTPKEEHAVIRGVLLGHGDVVTIGTFHVDR